MMPLGQLERNLLSILAADGGQHWLLASDLVGAGMAASTKDAAHTLRALHARGLVERRSVGTSACPRREWRIRQGARALV